MRSLKRGVSFQDRSLLRKREIPEVWGVGAKRQLISSVRSGLTAEVNFECEGRLKRSVSIVPQAEDILDGPGP